MKYLLSVLVILLACPITAQDHQSSVKATIIELFDGMRAGDTSRVAATFLPEATLSRVGFDENGQLGSQTSSVQDFLHGLARAKDLKLDEKLWTFDIRVDPPLATAWTDYTFFVNDAVHHCGINTFTLYLTSDGWKIARIEDTSHPPENCQTEADAAEKAIHQVLDAYHKAAAEADEDTFFGSMTEDGMYLGTDASERWLRDELKEWSKRFFERDSAWSFTPQQRWVYLSEDGTIAWFDELLDTWMGTCRGSGVLVNTAEGWKIKQYNLTIMVPNEHVNGLIELMKGED